MSDTEQAAPVDWQATVKQRERELKAEGERRYEAEQERDEARQWARHGYEIGQRHCSWSDHGVAPAWLTEGWPHHFDSCEHLKRASDLDQKVSNALAVIHAWQRNGEPNDYLTSVHRALAPPVSGTSSGPA